MSIIEKKTEYEECSQAWYVNSLYLCTSHLGYGGGQRLKVIC